MLSTAPNALAISKKIYLKKNRNTDFVNKEITDKVKASHRPLPVTSSLVAFKPTCLRGEPHEVIDVYPCWKSCWKAVGSVKFSIEIMLEKRFFGPVHRYTP